MIAAISIQMFLSTGKIVHTAALVSNDTKQDILDDARVLSVKYAREWAEQFSLEIEDITLAAQWEDGTWYHDPVEKV